MNRKNFVSPPFVGVASLLTVFAILCLTIFSLLSLSTVLAEQRLLNLSLENTKAYYNSELQAEQIFAQLRKGDSVDFVEKSENKYHYTCAISEKQELFVEVENIDGEWKILRWQSVSLNEGMPKSGNKLWDGEEL